MGLAELEEYVVTRGCTGLSTRLKERAATSSKALMRQRQRQHERQCHRHSRARAMIPPSKRSFS